MTRAELKELYRTQIDDLLEAVQLSNWEADFINSIDEKLDTYGTLTKRQAAYLEKIWTSFNERKTRKVWRP